MNIQNLLKYLKNDLGELSEILTELTPGQSLSEMEIKLIKSRIRSLTEEFDMLENEIDINPAQKKEEKTDQPAPQPGKNVEMEIDETPTATDRKTATETVTKHEEEAKPEDYRPEQQPEPQVEPPREVIDAPEETPEEEITEEEESRQQQEQEPQTHEPGSLKRTIADKYEGSSKSLHERIANLVEQKDLASKLQQNPIEDLTKAIKLNDKIWFINTLFSGDADLYRETVNRINQMNNLDEALQFLELNFEFNQQEDSFKSFIEFIYRRFLN